MLLDDFIIDANERLFMIRDRLNGPLGQPQLAEIYKHVRTINGLAMHLEVSHIKAISTAIIQLLECVINGTAGFSGRLDNLFQDSVSFLQLCLKELKLKISLGCEEQYLYLLNRLQAEVTIRTG
ncbi:hypothetical protein BVX99_00135 [bacterium F16]|nr:hypothetical protein BVX99_00135 [bacterium F16]